VSVPDDLHVININQADSRLGRQIVHDPRSRRFAAEPRSTAIKRQDRSHRIWDPRINPNQTLGNCTGVAECVMGNSAGNRLKGVTLGMPDADRVYSLATSLDPFDGQYPPTDTGSSGLAAAKAAVQLGLSTRYEWYFGIDAVLDGLQDHVLSVGTWWYFGMFEKDPTGLVRPTGGKAGGHQWALRSHDVSVSRLNIGKQRVGGRCWWGSYKDFWLTVDDFAELLADDGDVHRSVRVGAAWG
jgi:hypothetical protein